MKDNTFRKSCAWAGLMIGMAGPLVAGDIVLTLQQSTDGLSGWVDVPISTGDLTGEGAIFGGTVAPGESVFYRLDITELDPPPYVSLVINEVDYDQPSADTTEFVEILNVGTEAVDLAGISLVLINGSGGADYDNIDLGVAGSLAPGGYLVVAAAAVVVDPSATTILLAGSIQNGAPDGVAIVNMTEGFLIDALSYEGEITTATISGVPGFFNLVEGTATPLSDTGDGSLIRYPDGSDTNDASVDWVLTTVITPGAANAVPAP